MKISHEIMCDLIEGSSEYLLSSKCPEGVSSYIFEERGLSKETAKLAGIGFCPPSIERMVNFQYYNDNDSYPNISPQFLRDKIIVPIKDDCGKLVSFATRSIGKGQAWWNFPFTKGNYFYGLNIARSTAFKENKIYIVEGYFDCSILWSYGLKNVVSVMGTRFTLIHAGLAKRYCDRICMCFDADSSEKGSTGQKANKKAAEICKNFMNVSIINLPTVFLNGKEKGVDPDDYVIENGLESLLALEKEFEN